MYLKRGVKVRDLELMLNRVSDPDVKSYYKEALDCYNIGSFKACCILSVIAGMDDLYKKVDYLYKELPRDSKSKFMEIKDKKDRSLPFERDLIIFCGEGDGNLHYFSKHETNELNQCFDIRNGYAHPNDLNCTAEKARFVFTSMIDNISSKKIIYGILDVERLIKKINSPNLFYSLDEVNESKKQVDINFEHFLKKSHSKILKEIFIKISEDNHDINKDNYIVFFIYLYDKIDSTQYNDYFKELLEFEKINNNTINIIIKKPEILSTLDIEIQKRLLNFTINYIPKSFSVLIELYIKNQVDLNHEFILTLIESMENKDYYNNLLKFQLAHAYLYDIKRFEKEIYSILDSCHDIRNNSNEINFLEFDIVNRLSNEKIVDYLNKLKKSLMTSEYNECNRAVCIVENKLKAFFRPQLISHLEDILLCILIGSKGYSNDANNYVKELKSKDLYDYIIKYNSTNKRIFKSDEKIEIDNHLRYITHFLDGDDNLKYLIEKIK